MTSRSAIANAAPRPRRGLRRSAHDADVDLASQWSASTDDIGVAATTSTSTAPRSATTTATSFTFTGLACSTTYSSASRRSTPPAMSPPRALRPHRLRCATGPSGLVAAYAFDEGAGRRRRRRLGQRPPGTISGATWTSGRYGGALSFNGSNASVDLRQSRHLLQTGFTLEAWVQKADAARKDVAVVGTWAGQRRRCSGSTTLLPALPPDPRRRLLGLSRLRHGSDRGRVAAPRRHLRRDDRPLLHRRLRGRLPRRLRQRRQLQHLADRRLRRRPVGFFDGLIDDVRIYGRALSASEIQTDMNQPAMSSAGRDASDSAGRWPRPAASGRRPLLEAATDNVGVTSTTSTGRRRRLHPARRTGSRSHGHELHRYRPRRRHVLLQGRRRGRRRQRRSAVERGERDGRCRHDSRRQCRSMHRAGGGDGQRTVNGDCERGRRRRRRRRAVQARRSKPRGRGHEQPVFRRRGTRAAEINGAHTLTCCGPRQRGNTTTSTPSRWR